MALKNLKTLRSTSPLPIENLTETLELLADSAVETLAVECHEDNVEDECSGTGDRFGMEEGGLGLGGLDRIGCQGTYGRLHRTSRGR